jgi:hypothetical protein
MTRGPAGATRLCGRARMLSALALASAALAGVLCSVAPAACASRATPDDRLREGNEAARAGDYPRATAAYRALAAAGVRSASLYWNWAQSAEAQGLRGEALWALMRARQLEPGDATVARAIERLRQELSLDPAEIAPEPLAEVRRAVQRWHIDLVAAGLLGVSLAGRALQRMRRTQRGNGLLWASFLLGLLAALAAILGAQARATAVVLRRGVALLDAASPTAEPVGALREGEVVPILARSGGYLRIEDSSGARGWAHGDDVAVISDPR